MPETTNEVTTGGAVENNVAKSAEKDKDAEHAGKQKLIQDKFGATWKREESDRITGWYSLARLAFTYVMADLLHYGNGAKTFQTSCGKLVAFLSDFTDDAKASVSRLLATAGLWNLMADRYKDNFDGAEADEYLRETMDGLTVSLLKSLVRLVERDGDTPEGLVYVWKTEAIEKGFELVSDTYGEGYTVAQCRDAVDKLLAPTSDDSEEESASAGRKQASQKAVKGINSALEKAGKNGARKDTLRRAVKTEALTAEDVATLLGSIGADDLDKVIGALSPKVLLAVYKSCKEHASKLKSAAENASANGVATASAA